MTLFKQMCLLELIFLIKIILDRFFQVRIGMKKCIFYFICIGSGLFSIFYLYYTSRGGFSSKFVTVIKNNSTFKGNVTIRESIRFVVHSTFYYRMSKIYSPNSMIILTNGRRGAGSINFQCHSKNQTATFVSDAQIREAEPGPYCKWISYIINCTTVNDPTYFGLKLSNSRSINKIKFEYPEQKQYPVVMCYPPMVYESRWQQIIFATEIYHYFGTDLQIQYINSAMTEIVEILKIYERKKWVKIAKFAYIDFNSTVLSKIGYQPMLELDSRNQPIAYTDCMMRYRESSEFIIVADVDDILIPQEKSYFKEFSHWNKVYPFATAFMYFRVEASINPSNSFGNFSLFDTLNSLNVFNGNAVGKSVYLAKYAEAAWIHWPSFRNETTATISPKHGQMLHVGVGNTVNQKSKIMPQIELEKLSSTFLKSFKNFPSFNSNFAYADAIWKCYGESGSWNSTNRPCLTPLQCAKPKFVKGFKCQVAKRKFKSASFNESIHFFVPSSKYYWNKSNNGCNLFSY